MKKTLKFLTFTTAAVMSSTVSYADTLSNAMNNLVEVAAACDLSAIGIDFGVYQVGTAKSNIVTANTSVGSTGARNTSAGTQLDGAAGDGSTTDTNGDTLNLNLTSVAAIDSIISEAVGTLGTAVPGIIVICSETPDSLELSGRGATITLPHGAPATPSTVFNSKMTLGNQTAGATVPDLDYSIDFTSTVIDVGALPGAGAAATALTALGLPLPFIAAHVGKGAMPAAQTSTLTPAPGFYGEVATATVTF